MDCVKFITEVFPGFLVDFSVKSLMEYNNDGETPSADDVQDNLNEILYDTDGLLSAMDELTSDNPEYDNLKFYNGATKVVIIDKFQKSVFKIVTSDYDLRCSEYEIYRSAKNKGLEDYFAKTYEEQTLHVHSDEWNINLDLTWYEQEMVEEDQLGHMYRCREGLRTKEVRHMSKSSQHAFWTKDESYDDDFTYFASVVRTNRSDAGKLIKFLESQEVNDLHSGNFFIRKGMPVLFDFSGYVDD